MLTDLAVMLTAIFISLKILNVITWGWITVLSPFLIALLGKGIVLLLQLLIENEMKKD